MAAAAAAAAAAVVAAAVVLSLCLCGEILIGWACARSWVDSIGVPR